VGSILGRASRAARRGGLAFGAVAVALAASCRSGPEIPEEDPDRAGCEVSAAGPGGPVTDPGGPYYHQVAVASTTDGVTLTAPWQALDHASVPDAAVGPGGIPLVYYVNGADGPVWIARLLDDSANVVGPLVLDGIARPAGVVDPDATRLPDGRIRLVYLSGFGSPGSNVRRAFCIAESPDGVHFTVVQRALWVPANFTDPSVTQLADGTWLMGISLGGQTVLARSSDGYGFAVFDTLSVGGVPEVHALADGRVRLYVCRNGIESYLSVDRGATWTREATVVPSGVLGRRIVCDPSLVADAGLFVFKTAP
jgi:hypothetical protein